MVQELQQGQQSVARALEQLRSKLQKVTASLWAVGKQQAQGAEEGDEGVQGPEEARPGGVASSADQQQQQQEVDGADGDVPGVQEALLGLGAEVQQALNAGKAVGAAIAAMAGGLRAAHAQLQEVGRKTSIRCDDCGISSQYLENCSSIANGRMHRVAQNCNGCMLQPLDLSITGCMLIDGTACSPPAGASQG
eukprot:1158835-Pelagomonas_calceolata.AAC.18